MSTKEMFVQLLLHGACSAVCKVNITQAKSTLLSFSYERIMIQYVESSKLTDKIVIHVRRITQSSCGNTHNG